MSTVADQMHTDSDIRKDGELRWAGLLRGMLLILLAENIKLHNGLISWMVNTLVRANNEKPDTSWDTDFHQLVQEVKAFKHLYSV
jgi:hypothetical protein